MVHTLAVQSLFSFTTHARLSALLEIWKNGKDVRPFPISEALSLDTHVFADGRLSRRT